MEFNLPEEREELELAQKGWEYKSKLDDVWEEVFRPYRKHGYSDEELQNTIDAHPETARVVIEGLIKIYLEILNDR